MQEMPVSRTGPGGCPGSASAGGTGGEGLTVAIPTTGDRSSLRPAVEAVLQSAARAGTDTEVLVVVNGRADAPALRDLHSPLLRVIQLPKPNKSLARNAAIDAARHDTILFTDDDGVVPPQWCAQLRDGLARPGHAVVAAPVYTAATGPVTGFLEYQHAFMPLPHADGGANYAITLNCGIRRDRLPAAVRFDPAFLIAEDFDFSQSVRSSGLTIGWLPDAVPVQHDLPESFETISGRYLGYGADTALMHRKHGKVTELMPVFCGAYLATADGRHGYRRFSELVQKPVRTAFTIVEPMAMTLFFVGYLDKLGDELGRGLIEADQAALATAFGQIAAAAAAGLPPVAPGDWAAPAIDYSRFGTIDVDRSTAELDQVKAALARHARPLPALASATELAPTTDELPAWTAWCQRRAVGRRPTPDSVQRLFWEAGVSFEEGSRQVEIMLWHEGWSSRLYGTPAAYPA
jgi:GT2 family glycosyltransferase